MIVSNIEKEQILMFQFLNKSQIKKLMDCGSNDVINRVYDDCRRQAEAEGKTCYHRDKVAKSRVIKLLGISEKEIHRLAELERELKKGAQEVR